MMVHVTLNLYVVAVVVVAFVAVVAGDEVALSLRSGS